MKFRTILTAYDSPVRYFDGAIEAFHVHVERQDGTLANTGQGFEHHWQAELFADGASMALRSAGLLADPLPEHSPEAARRLFELRKAWEQARASSAQEARAYRLTRPPGSTLRDIALRRARRYRLALWVLGRGDDARTVTP